VLNLIERSVERRRFTGTGRAGHQHHAVRLADKFAELLQIVRIEADNFQIQLAERFVNLLFVENTDDTVFAVNCRHDGDTEVNFAPFDKNSETPVLRHTTFGNVEFGHDLDTLNNGLVMGNINRVGGAIEGAVNAVFHHDIGIARFDVNVRGAALQ